MSSADERKLCDACGKGDMIKVQQLIAQGANPNKKIVIRETSRVTESTHPLMEAISSGNADLVKFLLRECKVDIEKTMVRNVQDGRHHERIHQYDAVCVAIENCSKQDLNSQLLLENLIRNVKAKGKLDNLVCQRIYNSDSNE